jgi:hypothetical protein
MGRGYESPQNKAKRLAQRAINQIKNPQEKKKVAESLGYRLGTGKASGFLQAGPVSIAQNKQTPERVVKAIESATQPSSNPRAASMGATQVDIAKFQENLGETPKQEYERIQAAAREYEQRPFKELAAAEQQLLERKRALEAQFGEETRLRAQAQSELLAAEGKARVAAKRSAAVSGSLRSKAMLEQAQAQDTQTRTALAIQQRRRAGATVGQPGRARTRVASGLGIGGYGGTRAARVSPTGLNI